jgi:glucosamine-6-phosphate deaminase
MNPEAIYTTWIDSLDTSVFSTAEAMGMACAVEFRSLIHQALRMKNNANIILATGNSQIHFFESLINLGEIDWKRVNVFHLDDYIGLAPGHPARFPGFLERHLLNHLSPQVGAFFPIITWGLDPEIVCQEYEMLLRSHPIDVCALGIGENGHLAFNDPPNVDFEDPAWLRIVKLAEASRLQQVGEGHFDKLEDVPTHAITLTIPALLSARHILAVVPSSRKARAVYETLRGPISPKCPASILRKQRHAHLYLDMESAARAFPALEQTR